MGRHELRHVAPVQLKPLNVRRRCLLGYLLQAVITAAALRGKVGVGFDALVTHARSKWPLEIVHVIVVKQVRREQRVWNLRAAGIEYSYGQRQHKRSCALRDDGVECQAHVAQDELAVVHDLLGES